MKGSIRYDQHLSDKRVRVSVTEAQDYTKTVTLSVVVAVAPAHKVEITLTEDDLRFIITQAKKVGMNVTPDKNLGSHQEVVPARND